MYDFYKLFIFFKFIIIISIKIFDKKKCDSSQLIFKIFVLFQYPSEDCCVKWYNYLTKFKNLYKASI